MTDKNDAKAASDGRTNTAKPVPEHKSYGGSERDAVAGGPAGRGNHAGKVPDPGESWGRGEPSADDDAPVKPKGDKNPFS